MILFIINKDTRHQSNQKLNLKFKLIILISFLANFFNEPTAYSY